MRFRFFVLVGICFLSHAVLAENVVPSYGNVQSKGPVGDRVDRMVHNHVMATDVDYIAEPFVSRSERTWKWQSEVLGKWVHSMPDARLDFVNEETMEAVSVEDDEFRVTVPARDYVILGNFK